MNASQRVGRGFQISPIILAVALLLADCGPSDEPIYLRCDAKDTAPSTDDFLLLVIDLQRNEIKDRSVCPDCLRVTNTYRIIRLDPTIFVGMVDEPSAASPTFIRVDRMSGDARVEYKPPSPSLYYNCTPTKPVM